jgi:hypothetical protein
MKTGMVSSSEIAASPGLRLDAHNYLLPAKRVDDDIARTERVIERAKRRLVALKAKRERITNRRAK